MPSLFLSFGLRLRELKTCQEIFHELNDDLRLFLLTFVRGSDLYENLVEGSMTPRFPRLPKAAHGDFRSRPNPDEEFCSRR